MPLTSMILAAGLVVALGALVQGAVGYGMALVAAPLLVLSLLAWRPRLRPRALLLAGAASGVGGTAAGIGGPPIALLYQNEAGPRIRGTIAGYFVLGSVMSIAALAAAGQVTSESLTSAALLIPFLLAGFALSGPARRVLDNGRARRAVLAVAAASTVLLIGHAVLS